MPSKALFYILLSLLLTQAVTAQSSPNSLYFDHLTINDGLSHNTVFSVLQDQQGYIWIGTLNGLNKYDGYSFELYQSQGAESNKEGFVGKNISSLFEDSQGNLWVGTQKSGINVKAMTSDRFVNLQADSAFVAIKGHDVSSLFEDKAGNIWITTVGAGVLKYQPNINTAQVFNTENSQLSSNVTFDVVEDKYGTIWVATAGGGLNYLTDDEQFSTSHEMLPNHPNMNGYRKKILLDGEYLWLGTQGTGLYKMDLRDRSYTHFSKENGRINSNVVRDLFKTEDGRLFIATDGDGLTIYDTVAEEMSFYEHQAKGQAALNSNALLCLFSDRTDNIWVGTYNGGVNIYKPNKPAFDFLRSSSASNNDLPHQSTLSILQTQTGHILIGTDGGGLNWLNENKDNFAASALTHDPFDPSSIGGDKVKTLFEDSRGQLWVGLYAGGLDLYDPITKSFQHFMQWRPNVWSIAERRKGELLIATLGDGLQVLDPETKRISRFYPQTTTSNLSDDLNVMTVFVDNTDRIWIGNLDNGLGVVDEANNYARQFKYNPLDSFSISNNEVRTIFQDSSGDIWVGTEGGGLNRWLEEGRFERVTINNGLIANSVMGITEDRDGLLWITTFKGISRLNKKTGEIKNFNFRTFKNSNQFNQNTILTAKSGKLYFGGINGLHAIQPGEIIEDSQSPELLFTDLKVYGESIPVGRLPDGRTVLEKPIESSSDIWLSYLDQSFTIYFNAIDYTNPLANEFAYKIEGFNEDWLKTSTGQRSVTYTNLDAGRYVFTIKHREKTASITIHIKPPYWKTTWFRLLSILFSVGVFSQGLYFWIKRREAATNREILQLKNENLATEVEAKNSKLMFSSIQMAHKNEILEEVKKDLIDLGKRPEGNVRPLVRKLERELKNEDYWKEFNLYFNEVDQNFLNRIAKTHPSITKNDLRLCSLLRLNLSTKEIASLLSVSVRGVEQSRYRLKKRMDLEKGADLSKYILSFQQEV